MGEVLVKHALYITSYNDPGSCEKCMTDLATLDLGERVKILSDQSTDEFRMAYKVLAQRFGYQYVHNQNHGAQVTKHTIIRHALANGFSFMSQISEDFELTPPDKLHYKVVSGRETFLQDALQLLISRPNISFVNWTFVREGGFGYYWGKETPHMRLRNTPDIKLMWLTGDITVFNWPYTARVSAMAELLHQADIMGPGSEGAMAKVSLGHGACLLAQPVRHTGRKKPEGSRP